MAPRLEQIGKHSPQYLAHEYFNRDWALFYHEDVIGDMAKAKLSFVGSAHVIEQFDNCVIPGDAQAVFAEITDPVLRETVKDFMINQQFRRDVFARGAGRMSGPVHADAWKATRLALTRRREDCALKVAVPVGEANLSEAIYTPILDALAPGPRTFGELTARQEIAGLGTQPVLQAIGILVGLGYVSPALPEAGEAERRASTDRFNETVLARALKGTDIPCLASPVLGTAIGADILDQLFLAALKDGATDPGVFAWECLSRRNQRMLKDGKTLETPEENIAELRQRAETFRDERLPLLQQLGIA